MNRSRPRVKPFSRRRGAEGVVVSPDPGVEIELADPDGRIESLLQFLDGSRTVDEVREALGVGVSERELAEAIEQLDAAGLLEDAAAESPFTPWQEERYFSNLAFFGAYASLSTSRFELQQRLSRSHVVLLGVGGLGSTLLFNLAGLGVGKVTVVDSDKVEARNLARQFLYSEEEIGTPKVERAVARACGFNSELELVPVERRIGTVAELAPLLEGADLVLCAIDQPLDIRYIVNRACGAARVPFVTGGAWTGRGLYYSVDAAAGGCLECSRLLSERAPGGQLPIPNPGRVNRAVGPVASLLGSLVGLEALRYLTGFAPPVARCRVWLADFATGEIAAAYEWARVDDCTVCGTA